MSLFSSQSEYEPTPCVVHRRDAESIEVEDWRIWSDSLIELDRKDGKSMWVPLENVTGIVEE